MLGLIQPLIFLWYSLSFSVSVYIYIYIYIYCYPQEDCFVLSELFSVAWHAGRSKPGSKPVQLYVRLSFRPPSGPRRLREFLRCLFSNSSLCLHFLYPIGYQSALFFRRAFHYASGGRQFLRQSAQPPWGRRGNIKQFCSAHFKQIFLLTALCSKLLSQKPKNIMTVVVTGSCERQLAFGLFWMDMVNSMDFRESSKDIYQVSAHHDI